MISDKKRYVFSYRNKLRLETENGMNNFSSSLNGWMNTTEREVQLFLENGTVIIVETVIKLLMSALVAIASLVGNVSVIVVVF